MNTVNSWATEEEFFDEDYHHWKKEHWPALFGVEDHDPLQNKDRVYECTTRLFQKPPAVDGGIQNETYGW